MKGCSLDLIFLAGLLVCYPAFADDFCLPDKTGRCYNYSAYKMAWMEAQQYCKVIGHQLAGSNHPSELFDFLPGIQKFWIADTNPSDGCTILDKYESTAGSGLKVSKHICSELLVALCQPAGVTPTTTRTKTSTSTSTSTSTTTATTTITSTPTSSTTTPTTTTPTTTTTTEDNSGNILPDSTTESDSGESQPSTNGQQPTLALIIGVAAVGFILMVILIAVLVFLAFHCLKKPKSASQNHQGTSSGAVVNNLSPSMSRVDTGTSQSGSDIWPMAISQSQPTHSQKNYEPRYKKKESSSRTASTQFINNPQEPTQIQDFDPIYSSVDEVKQSHKKPLNTATTQPVYSVPNKLRTKSDEYPPEQEMTHGTVYL